MPDETSPAPVVTPEAPEAAGEQAAQVAPPAPAAAAPTPEPAQPDYKTLLKDPEYRKLVFADEEIRREIEHRAKSEAGRLTKAQMDAWERQQQAQAELARVEQMDDDEAGQAYKRQVTQQRTQLAEQQRLAQLQAGVYGQLAQETYSVVQNSDLDDAEKARLDPRSEEFRGWGDYLKAVTQAIGAKEAKKLAKDLAKKEAEAIVQERLGQERDATPSLPTLPVGGPAQSSGDFLREFAGGKNNDMGRARKVLQELGLSI